jgi:hypothetical protein
MQYPITLATATCHPRNNGRVLPMWIINLLSIAANSSSIPDTVPGITTRAQFSNVPNSLHINVKANVSVALPTSPPSTPQTADIKFIVGKYVPGAAISANICSIDPKAYSAVFAAAIHAIMVDRSIAKISKGRCDTHNQMARLSTIPKNTPGKSGTPQNTKASTRRMLLYQAKLLRSAEITARGPRIIGRSCAEALLSLTRIPSKAVAPLNQSKIHLPHLARRSPEASLSN